MVTLLNPWQTSRIDGARFPLGLDLDRELLETFPMDQSSMWVEATSLPSPQTWWGGGEEAEDEDGGGNLSCLKKICGKIHAA